jgi:hypothetical protein
MTESVDAARRSVAAENRRLAEEDEKEAVYHAAMAVCLSTVGDCKQARTERSRASLLRRTAQVKRDIAQKSVPRALRELSAIAARDSGPEALPRGFRDPTL